MDKHATVIESIQKLINLGVSDKEIADNLYDVGIEESEAMSLIKEARSILLGEKFVHHEPPPSGVSIKEVSSSDSLSMNDEIVQQIPIPKKTLPLNEGEEKSVEDSSTNISEEEELDEVSGFPNPNKSNEKEFEDFSEDKAEALTEEESGANEEQVSAKKTENVVSSKTFGAGGNIKESDFVELEKKVSPQKSAPTDFYSKSNQKVVMEPVKQNVVAEPVNKKITSETAKKSDSSKPFISQSQNNIPISQKASESFKTVGEGTIDFGSDENFDELWKKGIVVAVNTKLAEMKRLKDDIDNEILQKVEESMRKELYQYKVLVDSQKDLITSSNKEALDQKQKEIVFIIDAKIAELRQYNKQLGDNLAVIESSKKQQQDLLNQISTALDDARRTKTQLVVEMNSELIRSKSNAQAFLDSASAHIAQMDERINKALELEKNIAEGMLAQAEQRIEQLTIARADELIAELQVELNRLQATSKKISPEAIEQKIVVLEEFKKQFLTSMQDALNQINFAIEELNEKNAIAERVLEEKTLAFDAKIEELTKFEKDLTDRLEKKLGKK